MEDYVIILQHPFHLILEFFQSLLLPIAWLEQCTIGFWMILLNSSKATQTPIAKSAAMAGLAMSSLAETTSLLSS